MRDRVCPIGDCTATVRFEQVVVEVTPRYRLHDLGEVDEFAVCPDCDAEVAGFYEETEGDEGGVELILDIDEGEDGGEGAVDGDGDEAAGDGGGVDSEAESGDDLVEDGGERLGGDGAVADDGFDAPEDVLGADR